MKTFVLKSATACVAIAALAASGATNAQTVLRRGTMTVKPATGPVVAKPVSIKTVAWPETPEKPDIMVITKNGRSITLGELRAKALAATAIPENQPPKMITRNRVPTPPAKASFLEKAAQFNDPGSMMTAPKSCEELNPRIRQVSGEFKPGHAIEIVGPCLGAKSGSVRLTGPYAGGRVDLRILHWQEDKIVAEIPRDIRGVADGEQALQVARPDQHVSNERKVWFEPDRVDVDVTYKLQRLSTCRRNGWNTMDCQPNGLNAFSSNGSGDPPPGSILEEWAIELAPSCNLYGLGYTSNAGLIARGYDDGPNNASKFTIGLNGQHWYDDGFWSNTYFYRAEYHLFVKANCPVGVTP